MNWRLSKRTGRLFPKHTGISLLKVFQDAGEAFMLSMKWMTGGLFSIGFREMNEIRGFTDLSFLEQKELMAVFVVLEQVDKLLQTMTRKIVPAANDADKGRSFCMVGNIF
ncbi:hypothetical protein [Paenibacillus oleatilyticus]|uniref:hypothetical protein n=1 Tax=Paenibacillus oleatilyticus TaxID=2594886 RepID=UPI001C1FC23E|nr:hypothetical protein [Paenibacillus oleatilyticus]MBU7315470.1 hypothetical protein [Paenibacillus oleatilyticus]